MNRGMRRGSLGLALVGVAVVASCGGSSDGGASESVSTQGDDAVLAAAITASLIADDADGFGEIFDTGCMGTEIVAGLGGAARADEKYGINPESVEAEGELLDTIDLEQADAEAVLAGYESCGDFDALLRTSFIASGATEDVARCVVEQLPDDAMRDAILEDFTSTEPGPAAEALDTALATAAAQCTGS